MCCSLFYIVKFLRLNKLLYLIFWFLHLHLGSFKLSLFKIDGSQRQIEIIILFKFLNTNLPVFKNKVKHYTISHRTFKNRILQSITNNLFLIRPMVFRNIGIGHI